MGSSSSKAVRKLPKAPPTWAGARTPGEFKYPEGVLPLGTDKVQPPSRGPSGDSTKSPGGPLDYGVIHPSGAGTEHATGRKNTHASEKKDDTIMRDGADPDFMANLSRLGQVAVPKQGLSFEKQAPALRTMLSRSTDYTSTSSVPPPNCLTASMLSSLLDRIKTIPEGQSIAKLCKEYNISEAKLNDLTRWVNSPSVDKDRTQVVLSEDGEESVKMMAVWVDKTTAEPKALPSSS
ncbi:hypothetical protein QFC22_000753 [Naganishia vaughanmartiniae]|uniref:Uncharacterized protein n=1 Tax=Naganishia vaughanmartiniae TaxID=1424756 RepID=A0ACC2XMN0_9TREE|nr:hypothetical protein QFC22_000753 [Naganishia vaughanmartiniae]